MFLVHGDGVDGLIRGSERLGLRRTAQDCIPDYASDCI